MSEALAMGQAPDPSPRRLARLAGLFELLEGLSSALGQAVVLGRLPAGDAAATAAGLLQHERLFWLGFALSLVAVVFHVVWGVLFYLLFKPVSRAVSLIAAFVMLVGCAVQAVAGLLYRAPMAALQGGGALSAFTPAQQQALTLLSVRLNGQAFNVYLVFFGFWCILTGWLVFRSRFLPRVLGVLLAIDGVGWATFLVPPLAHRLFPVIATASAVAELPLILWLLAAGVNEQRWREQAGAADLRA